MFIYLHFYSLFLKNIILVAIKEEKIQYLKVLYKRRKELRDEYLTRNRPHCEPISSPALEGNKEDGSKISLGERLKPGKINIIQHSAKQNKSSDEKKATNNVKRKNKRNNHENDRKNSCLECMVSDDGMRVTLTGISQSLLKKLRNQQLYADEFNDYSNFETSTFPFRKRKEVKYCFEGDSDDNTRNTLQVYKVDSDEDFEL